MFYSSGSQPFFRSRHPYSVFKIFGGTPGLINRYKNQGKVTIGGTPGTSSRHPGWEPLFYRIEPLSLLDFYSSNRIWLLDDVKEKSGFQ